MKFIKKHINLTVFVGIIILTIAGALLAKSIFFPNEAKAIYGNRLDGRQKVEIKDDKKNSIQQALSESAKSTNVRVQGRIIYITSTVNDEIDVNTAKSLGLKVLEQLSDEEKAYYDIQLLISNDANQDNFPIIGYKHHTSTSFSWTKDR